METAAPELVSSADVRFKDYFLENVYLRTTPAQRSEIIAFWRDEEAVSHEAEAERRVHEAVFLVRAGTGQLTGLSTVGFVRTRDGRTFYAYRMFLRKRDRVPYLMVRVILTTRDFLRTFQHPKMQPAGLLHVNENPKLIRPGVRKLFERHGYRYWGKTPKGEEVWAVEFGEQDRGRMHRARWWEALKSLVHHWVSRHGHVPKLTVFEESQTDTNK